MNYPETSSNQRGAGGEDFAAKGSSVPSALKCCACRVGGLVGASFLLGAPTDRDRTGIKSGRPTLGRPLTRLSVGASGQTSRANRLEKQRRIAQGH